MENKNEVFVIHGGDTDDGGSRLYGVYSSKEKAMYEYKLYIAKELVLLGMVENGGEELDIDTITESQLLEISQDDFYGIDGVDYSDFETNISCSGYRIISYYLSKENIE